MSHFETWNHLTNSASTWADASTSMETAKQDMLVRIEKLNNSALKALAEKQLQNLQSQEAQIQVDQHALSEARLEFKQDLDALSLLQNKFWNLTGFQSFTNFLTNQKLSENELENFFDFVNQKWPEVWREFRKNGFPTSRESYMVFADKLGIQTSATLSENSNDLIKDTYFNSLTELKSIQHLPEVEGLVKIIASLETLEGSEAQDKLLAINMYLVWPDGQSWNLDTILTALKKQDAENANSGNPTNHFETFTRTVRDFSPDVSKRIDVFIASYEPETFSDSSADTTYKQAIIDGAIPAGADVDTDIHGNIIAGSNDESEIKLSLDGNHIDRSIKIAGLEDAVMTPIEQADFSKTLGAYEAVRKDLTPKLKHSEQVLQFLNNPKFADVPLAHMQEGIRKILGYTLYTKLGISSMTDKEQVSSLMQSNIGNYTQELEHAEKTYNGELRKTVARTQERYRDQDEKIKTTLRAVKNSGLGFLDVSYLTSQIKSGFTHVNIGVPVEIQNYDLAQGNFWEPASVTDNPTKHIEYIYRTANKILTGSPDWLVDGKLVWFSLELAILNPNVAQKTDGELKVLLTGSGVWNETTGVDKAKMLDELGKPISPALG